VRRLLSILLLLAFGLPFATPLLALSGSSDTTLPACCRRDGKHHCARSTSAESTNTPSVSAPLDRCPYAPAALRVAPQGSSHAPIATLIALPLTTPLAATAEPHSAHHAEQIPPRQMRGPPASFL
jgi:hypothetical protein